MPGLRRDIRRRVRVFVPITHNFRRYTVDLEKSAADFHLAARHNHHATDHFSSWSPTFGNRAADIRFSGSQNAFDGAPLLGLNAHLSHDAADFGWLRSESPRVRRQNCAAVSSWPFPYSL
jgi:hypothetical protein